MTSKELYSFFFIQNNCDTDDNERRLPSKQEGTAQTSDCRTSCVYSATSGRQFRRRCSLSMHQSVSATARLGQSPANMTVTAHQQLVNNMLWRLINSRIIITIMMPNPREIYRNVQINN